MVNEGGGPRPQAHLTLVLEGYSAPVTAGNFASNVLQRLYIGKTLTVDYTGILVGKGTVSGGASCISMYAYLDVGVGPPGFTQGFIWLGIIYLGHILPIY